MFILLDSTSFIVFKKVELNKNKKRYSFVILNINMWFISRCMNVDSLNSCFQQQKAKMSYNFGLPDLFGGR
jgi:hypothetical protein